MAIRDEYDAGEAANYIPCGRWGWEPHKVTVGAMSEALDFVNEIASLKDQLGYYRNRRVKKADRDIHKRDVDFFERRIARLESIASRLQGRILGQANAIHG